MFRQTGFFAPEPDKSAMQRVIEQGRKRSETVAREDLRQLDST